MSCQTPQIKSSKKGFTLVEVLIVLVIISIMSGLLITVIDPARQRARARDGNVIATANKIISAISAYNSAVGSYPTCLALAGPGGEIQNANTTNTCNQATHPSQGSFTVSGIVLPADLCAAAGGGWNRTLRISI